MNPTPRELLDAAAGTRIPADINLTPRILQSVRRIDNSPNNWRTFMQTLRAKPALMILFVLLALALLSGAAYAIGRSLGYIPGVGIIEQGAPIRVLAEPVSQTREGITVTITNAILASDKTIITYSVENLPEHGPSSLEMWEQAIASTESVLGCYEAESIHLPNGSLLTPQSITRNLLPDGHLETRIIYPANIPTRFEQARFLLGCFGESFLGKVPENRSMPLYFVSAPPDLTVFPVVAPNSHDASAFTDGLILEKVVDTETGYVLVGKIDSSDLPYNAQAVGMGQWPRVTDANGMELTHRFANDVYATTSEAPVHWALEIIGKEQAWPVTIHIEAARAEMPELAAQFTFDAGSNPQPGQEWLLNQDVPMGDFIIRVNKITFTGTGYTFEMSVPDDVDMVHLRIPGTFPSGRGSTRDYETQGKLVAYVEYNKPPTGSLTVSLYSPTLTVPGDWRLQWQPENAPSLP
jgi:hypothetical protein